jgi:hypothetical protein
VNTGIVHGRTNSDLVAKVMYSMPRKEAILRKSVSIGSALEKLRIIPDDEEPPCNGILEED